MDQVEDFIESILKDYEFLQLRRGARYFVQQDQGFGAHGVSWIVEGSDHLPYTGEDALLGSFWTRIVYGSDELERIRSRVVIVVLEEGQQDVYVILSLP